MVLIISAAVLAAWTLASRQYQPRHHSPRLNFLDDYKEAKEQAFYCPPGMDPDAISAFIGEVNSHHMEELRMVAHVRGTDDGVDWTNEELVSVSITAVDDRGMLLQEMLCSAIDQRCIAVDVPIPWPPNMPVGQLPDMRKAFAEISRHAYAAALDELPPEYQQQQSELNPLMSFMNGEFQKLLRFYALKHAREALSPTEQVDAAKMTQLTFEGLSLELTTLDVAALDSSACTVRLTHAWHLPHAAPLPSIALP